MIVPPTSTSSTTTATTVHQQQQSILKYNRASDCNIESFFFIYGLVSLRDKFSKIYILGRLKKNCFEDCILLNQQRKELELFDQKNNIYTSQTLIRINVQR